METEEITKLVDGIYKNILDKFNPGARQLITAGKAYLKALHGAAAASRLYVDAISKMAKQAQQGTWGASADIGAALLQIVDVYKEIQAQQMNILKAFYVDMLVPLETNLEKDTKVIQSEQKRFFQQHKQRSETYSKAAAAIKKQRKKTRGKSPAAAIDREVKSLQTLEEERAKLDAFCETSLKTAMTQERRRYGFVLERQCSLAKHFMLHHAQGKMALEGRLATWQEVAHSREALPEDVQEVLATRMRQISSYGEDGRQRQGGDDDDDDDDRMSVVSQLRKSRSMDASCMDLRSSGEAVTPRKPPPPPPLSRAKSDFNLTASTHSLLRSVPEPRPKSMAVSSGWEGSQLARALYPYISSGDNQLSFLEGDVIEMLGERNKGWQFGENLRTHSSGWFPLAYTELLIGGEDDSSPIDIGMDSISNAPTTPASPARDNSSPLGKTGHSPDPLLNTPSSPNANVGFHSMRHQPLARQGGHTQSTRTHTDVGSPPPLPAPVPRRKLPPPPLPPLRTTGANASLHSSNDSGFSNDPPPAPEVDYSDDENPREKSSKRGASLTLSKQKLRGWLLYKSALDLWEDVNNNTGNHITDNGHQAVRQQSSTLAHLATLGRFSSAENRLRPPSPVKRSKSLWKFRRLQRPGSGDVLEGMALWQHRSLVDVPTAVGAESKNTSEKTAVAVQTEALSDSDTDESNSNYCLMVEDHKRRASVNGLLAYGQTLRKRLSKPDRGSRFDQRSQTTGNMCGPWYDLWGLDESVVK